MRDMIISAAARAIWVDWWADQCICGRHDYETCRLARRKHPERHRENGSQPGVDLMSPGIAPPTPEDAMDKARALIADTERMNDIIIPLGWKDEPSSIVILIRPGDTAEDFGFRLAMQALGHGVGLSDDDDGYRSVKVPRIDYMGRDIYPGPVSGYCFGASSRYPKEPEIIVRTFDRDDAPFYRWVGTARIDGVTCNAWRTTRPVKGDFGWPRYVFQTRLG